MYPQGVPHKHIRLLVVHPDITQKIMAWAGKRFWIITQKSTSVELLFTLGSTQVLKHTGAEMNLSNNTTRLVLVVPRFAAVTVTCLLPATSEARVEDQEWLSNDLRQQLLGLLLGRVQHARRPRVDPAPFVGARG